MESKFFLFRQNNSGGSFIHDEVITENMIIEGRDLDELMDIVEDLGIYFDGVRKKRDCRCCGDRWDSDPDQIDLVKEGFDSIEDFVKSIESFSKESPRSRIFFLDGTVKEFD